MRKYLYMLLGWMCMLLGIPTPVYAYGVELDGGTFTITPPSTPTEVYGLDSTGTNTLGGEIQAFNEGLLTGGNWLFFIGYLIVVSMVIYGGIRIAMSEGNPQKRESARDIIITALVAGALLGSIHVVVGLAFSFFSLG